MTENTVELLSYFKKNLIIKNRKRKKLQLGDQHHSKKILGPNPSCMVPLCLPGFFMGTPASSPCPKKCMLS